MAVPTYFLPSQGNADWFKKRTWSTDRSVSRANRNKHYCQQPLFQAAGSSPVLYSEDRATDEMFNQITKINNHLYLSGLQAITPERLHMYGVTLVVTAMMDPLPSNLMNAVASTLHVNVEDVETSNLRIHFDAVADRISREAKRGGKALVHCMAGISRSASLVMAYLIKYQKMSLLEAYNHVKSVRPIISPNLGFWRQLISYEEVRRGSRSMKITTDETSRLNIPCNSLRSYAHMDSYDRCAYPQYRYPGNGDGLGRYSSDVKLSRRYLNNRMSDYSRY